MSKAIVIGVKAMLEARGQQWHTNEDSFQILGRVAFALRDQGAMLIEKTPSQNGADVVFPEGVTFRVSHDSIAFPGRQWIDCLRSAGPPDNANEPVWNGTGSSNAPLLTPFDLDAGIWPPVVVDPPDVPDDGDPVAVALAALQAVEAAFAAVRLDLKGVQDQVTLLRGELLSLRLLVSKGWTGTTVGSVYGRTTITLTPTP